MGYLTVAEWKTRTIMPPADVDRLEATSPGFLLLTLDDWSETIDARLRKKYAAPFTAPVPKTILRWLTKLVTRDAYAKRGFAPQDDVDAINGAAEQAELAIKEAADAKDGLYDLPLRADLPTSAQVSGGPLGTAQASPYDWIDEQAEAIRGR